MALLNVFTIFFVIFLKGPASLDHNLGKTQSTEISPQAIEETTSEDTTNSESTSVAANPAQAQKLAKCLTAKGAVMYGAYWCPHCAAQKKLFGDSFSLIKYQECDPSGPGGNPAICEAAGIESYPTWQIPGSATLQGTQTFEALSTASNCPLT